MRADGHAAGRPAPDGQDAAEVLRRCARDVVDVAEGIRAVSARTGTALCAPDLTAAVRRRPRTGLAVQWALVRALTHRQGLGGPAITAPTGRGHVLGAVGGALGRESLAARAAVTSLRLGIAAVLADHPEVAREPGMRRLLAAVTARGGPGAVRALRALLRDRGAQRALSGLTPLMAELLAVRALLDEDPRNDGTDGDGTGRARAAGREPSAGPDKGERVAEAVELTVQERRFIAVEGTFLGFLRNIEVLATDGRILVQNVRGPDGVVRYVVQAPGTAPGRPRNHSPRDLVGAWRNQFTTDSPYTRSILLALADHGIPRGAELALIGHGEGGTALLNLTRDTEFCRAYQVTHVVAVGSPADGRTPADPHTWVATITNRHDIVPVPVADGRGAGSTATSHPHGYAVDYAGPTQEFPLCHMLRAYIAHLRTVVPDARKDVDEALAAYRGPIVRTQAYRLTDRAHPPEGHPFLTLPTASVATTAGPVDVPVRYYDSSAAHLCYLVPADAAGTLLPGAGRLTPSRLGRRALAVLSLYEHRCTTIGPYTELALSVLVDDLWRPRPNDVVADLLRRTDLRRTGRYVLSLAVTGEEARVVAREIWGQPALRMTAEGYLTGREISLRARDLGVAVEGRLGPGACAARRPTGSSTAAGARAPYAPWSAPTAGPGCTTAPESGCGWTPPRPHRSPDRCAGSASTRPGPGSRSPAPSSCSTAVPAPSCRTDSPSRNPSRAGAATVTESPRTTTTTPTPTSSAMVGELHVRARALRADADLMDGYARRLTATAAVLGDCPAAPGWSGPTLARQAAACATAARQLRTAAAALDTHARAGN